MLEVIEVKLQRLRPIWSLYLLPNRTGSGWLSGFGRESGALLDFLL